MPKLDKKEILLVKEKLSKLKLGDLPLPIFLEVCRLCVLATVEIVPMRLKGDSIEILLTKRSSNDPTWPGLYHLPGTVIRAKDKLGCFEDAFKRIFSDELRGVKIIGAPVFIGSFFRDLGRGKEMTSLYWVLVSDNKKIGKFFSPNYLPNNIIKKQIKFIKIAVKHFKNNRNS